MRVGDVYRCRGTSGDYIIITNVGSHNCGYNLYSKRGIQIGGPIEVPIELVLEWGKLATTRIKY